MWYVETNTFRNDRIMILEAEKQDKVALCRKCYGTGILNNEMECDQCCGSGRVLVSAKIVYNIRPYTPTVQRKKCKYLP